MRAVIIFIGLAISIAASWFVYNMISGDATPVQAEGAGLVVQPQVVEKPVPTQDVYVASREIKVGDLIQQDMLDRQPWPKHLIGPNFVLASDAAPVVIGMVARTPFSPGEIVLDSKLANPQDPSFIAASIPDGTRAITISVNPISGVAGFIYPGDRVDVMITHTLYSKKNIEREKDDALEQALVEIEDLQSDKKKPKQGELEDRLSLINAKLQIVSQREKEAEPVTEVFVSDVRVLAVNQRAVLTGEAEEKKELPQTITLEVLKEDAQRIKLAEREGQISLALRSLHDKSTTLEPPSMDGDLSRTIPSGYVPKLYEFGSEYPKELLVKKKPMRHSSSDDKANTITVVRGVKVDEIEFEGAEDKQ